MAAKAEMALILSLVDEVTKTARKVKDDLKGIGEEAYTTRDRLAELGGKLARLGADVVMGGIAVAKKAITGLGTAAFDAGMEYDEAMDRIAIATGATGDELEGLGADFSSVFTRIPVDAKTASGVVAELNRTLGVSGDALVDLAAPLAEASRMLGTDAAQSAEAFAEVMNRWQVDAQEAPAALDALFVATQQSGVGFNSLLSELTFFGAQLQTMGFSLSESTALLTALEKAGMPAAFAMSGLQAAAKAFTKEGLPLREGLQETIAAISQATSTEEALALGMQVFGARAAVPMVEAIRAGKFELGELTAALQNSQGAIMGASAATADFPEKLQVLKNLATDALVPLGLAFMDIVTTLVERFTPAFQAATGWLQENVVPVIMQIADAIGLVLAGDLQGAIASLFGDEVAAKVMTFLDGVRQVWGFIQDNLTPILAAAGAMIMAAVIPAFTAWAAAAIPAAVATIAACAPVILIVGAIGAAVGLLVAAWKNDWGGIQEKTAAVVEWIKTNVEAFLTAIRGWWDEHGAAIIATVTGLWETVKGAFTAAFEWVKNTVSTGLAAIKAWWGEHGEAVKTVVTQLWTGVKTAFETAFGFLKGIFEAFRLAFQGDWYGFGEKLRTTFLGAVDKVKEIWQTFKSAFLGVWEILKSTFGEAWTAMWERIKTTFTNARDALLGWFRELPGKLVGFVTETDWGQVGRNILQGIANGLTAGLDWLRDAARRVAQAALDAMKGLLGIGSPSKVAEMTVGLPIGQGIIEGLRAATPALLDASRMMMDESLGAMSVSGGQGMAQMSAPASSAESGGYIRGYSPEALRQMFEVGARSITMPLAAAIAERLQGGDEGSMGGTLLALGATI
jgi:phage-related minor tail protein